MTPPKRKPSKRDSKVTKPRSWSGWAVVKGRSLKSVAKHKWLACASAEPGEVIRIKVVEVKP